MDFNNQQAIYLQIAEYVSEQILVGSWQEGDKIPSVRELAVTLEVNPNTVMRSYEHLQQKEVIFTKRGMGYFVSEDAGKSLQALKKQQFMEEELPAFFKKLKLAGFELEDLEAAWQKFVATNPQNDHENKY